MSKLIIPAAELIGTPLTTEELKGILAGRDSQTCMCTLTYANGNSDTPIEIHGVSDSASCASQCHDRCSTTLNCRSYTWSFPANGGGSI